MFVPYANRVLGRGFLDSSLVAVFHLVFSFSPLPLRKPEGVLQERVCAGLLLRLPVVTDVQECSGTLHQGNGVRAEGETPGLGCCVFRVYHGG